MLKNIYDKIITEPLAVAAILLTVVLSILQSNWFANLIGGKVYLNAYYEQQADGRCSLKEFSIDNKTQKAAPDLKIAIIVDYLVKQDKYEIGLYDRKTGIIPRGVKTYIPYRDVLDIKYEVVGQTINIPILLPGEYVDLFLRRPPEGSIFELSPKKNTNFNLDEALKHLANDEYYRFTPRIGPSAFVNGELSIINHGNCIDEFS